MSEIDWFILLYALVFCLLWCALYLQSWLRILRMDRLEREPEAGPAGLPRLSVVVAACNEADTIEGALSSLLAEDYPGLQVVVVDDRSSDGTGRVLERIARTDERLQVTRVDELPSGWMGKVHALEAGLRRATGEWVLFTDADVHFRRGTLRRAVGLALGRGVDHLVLVPLIVTRSFWLEVVVQAFAIGFLQLTRAGRVSEPGSDAIVGAGAFNLFRRAALERSEGLGWLRMEVADDVGLGLVLGRAGARSLMALALEHVRVEWYPCVAALVGGLEKNAFAVARYSGWGLVAIPLFTIAFNLAPLVALAWFRVPWLWTAGLACYLVLALLALTWRLGFGRPLAPVLLIQVGHFLLTLAFLRSGLLCLKRGGIVWRGTSYPIQELRAGQRVRLGPF